MTPSMLALLAISVVAFVLVIGGWVRADLVGMLVLSTLALTGLVTPQQAVAGFGNPAVITVWAMFILSAAMTRTGVAHRLGKPLLRFAKSREPTIIVVLMIVSSLLSALINTVTVAAILLPPTMELIRRSGRPASRLLMPLALGCLLGGPFTSISTTPNILATEALKAAGLEPFGLFDITGVTAAIVVVGTAFVAFWGRHLLPKRSPSAATDELGRSYDLAAHLFSTQLPENSPLLGKTLAESHLASALHLTVVAIQRRGALLLAPRADEVLSLGDRLIMHGRPDHLRRFHGSEHLRIESREELAGLEPLCGAIGQGVVHEGSPLVGLTMVQSDLRREHGVHVLALGGCDGCIEALRQHEIVVGDRLILQGKEQSLRRLEQLGLISELHWLDRKEAAELAGGCAELLPLRVPEGSVLAGSNLLDSRMGHGFGLTAVGLIRGGEARCMPSPTERIEAGDLLILQGSSRDFEVLDALQALEIREPGKAEVAELESQQVGVTEVLLSPRTSLAGKTLGALMFRERYGVSVLAIWREGRAFRTGLQEKALQFGDALLVYGRRSDLALMARDPDFVVLDEAAAQAPRLDKAGLATAIMLGVLASAMLGYLPISIAALMGAALMVLVGCLRMEEAYQAIEWKVVFLIASMLPLGAAIESTGVSQIAAEMLIAGVGKYGPRSVIAALFAVTVIGVQVIPSAAIVVLMAPIALSTSSTLGISSHLLMMTVSMAAAASYASPLSHPAHLLVMGPGGYRFMDYVKVGVPVTLLAFGVSVVLLPLMWPP